MRHMGRWAAFSLVVLCSSSGEAQSFYAVSGGRVMGCRPNDTLTINAECTSYQTGLVIGPAVPIEAWVTAQVQGALTSRVQALEAALKRSTREPPRNDANPGRSGRAGGAGETCRRGTCCGTIGRMRRASARHQCVVQEIPSS